MIIGAIDLCWWILVLLCTGDGITMHNWAFYGNAVVTDDYVRYFYVA